MRTLHWAAIIGLVASAGLVACGSSDSGGGTGSSGTAGCTDLCLEAQAGHCTTITGDCSAFCHALDGVQGPSGCTDEREAYQGCLNQRGGACAGNCEAQESALISCLAPYCQANSTNADCVVIKNSF